MLSQTSKLLMERPRLQPAEAGYEFAAGYHPAPQLFRGTLILLTLSAALALAQPQTNPVVGRWRSTDVSASGISAIFEFRGANELDTYSAAITEGKYRVVGTDTILLESKGGREQKLELEWDNKDRVLIDDEAAGKKIELTRLGKCPDTEHPVVGEWRTTLPWNGKTYPARALFGANGSVLWITDLRADHGRYSVQDGNIRLEIPNRPQVDGKYALDGNRLVLPKPDGGESSFERF
jgi:hypothetical protein